MLTEAKAAASQAVGLDQLLTTNEVARLLRVSRVTLWEWRRKGLVPAPIKVGLNRLRWRARGPIDQPLGRSLRVVAKRHGTHEDCAVGPAGQRRRERTQRNLPDLHEAPMITAKAEELSTTEERRTGGKSRD